MSKIKTATKKPPVKLIEKPAPIPIKKETPIPPKVEDGKFPETDVRTIHRYHLILKELDIPVEELKGASPEESSSVLRDTIREFKEARTEEQILLQNGSTVVLGEKTYEIPPLTFRNSIEFRKRCGEFAKNMFDFILTHAQRPGEKPTNREVQIPFLDEITKNSGIDMNSLLNAGMPYITGDGFEEILDILFLCSKELESDRDLILDTANLVQLSHASLVVFRTAFPFVVNLFRGMWISYGHAKTAGLPGMK